MLNLGSSSEASEAQVKPHKIIKNVHFLSQTGQIQMVNMGSPMEANEAQVKHHEIIKNVHFLSQIGQIQMVNLENSRETQVKPHESSKTCIFFHKRVKSKW